MCKLKNKFLWLVTLLISLVVFAENNLRLQDGTPIFIDQNTKNVYAIQGGVVRPLWGGVHRLDNGSSLTVNGGVLINQFQTVEQNNVLRYGPLGEPSRCEVLVTKACGSDNNCANQPGCQAARQLWEMEKKERTPNDSPTLITPSSDSCIEALADANYFAVCDKN